MSKMKSIATMMAIAAIAMESSKRTAPKYEPVIPPMPKGLKPFTIEGVEVWAINEKNARKKAAKKK